MINDFMKIGHVVGDDGHDKSKEAVEALAVGRRGTEPRKFKDKELQELHIIKVINDYT